MKSKEEIEVGARIASALDNIADGLQAIAKALTQGPDDSQPEQPETYLDGKPVNERPLPTPPPPPHTGGIRRGGTVYDVVDGKHIRTDMKGI